MNEQNPVVPKPRGRPPKVRPVEPAPEQQLAKVMDQIKATLFQPNNPTAPAAQNQVLAQGHAQAFVEDVIVHPVIDYTRAGQLTVSDIVQVVNPNSLNYGVVFIIGDIKGTKVHGFYLQPGAKKEFLTVDITDITNDKGLAIYGEARVKSRQPVSQQWKDEHGQTN